MVDPTVLFSWTQPTSEGLEASFSLCWSTMFSSDLFPSLRKQVIPEVIDACRLQG